MLFTTWLSKQFSAPAQQAADSGLGKTVLIIIVLAILVEAVVNTFKLLMDAENTKARRTILLSMGISVFITILTGKDLFALLGLRMLAWLPVTAVWLDIVSLILGTLFTGIIISRGSNYVSDLHKKIFTAVNPTAEGGG